MACQATSARAASTPAAPVTPPAAPPCEVLISVPEQRLAVVCDGQLVARYPISTSRFGTGDNYGSYKTPLGDLRVCDKIGADLSPGAVIRHRSPTGEVLPVNAPGRDPIVTRLIWLDGIEPQNKNARSRGIYIHGTPDERTIGSPVSWGCIRMRSKDVIKVFDQIPVGTLVSIIPDRLPHMKRYEPPKIQPPADNSESTEPPAIAEAPAPSSAPAKPPGSPITKPLVEFVPRVLSAPPQPISPPPQPSDHDSEHSSASAWRLMSGSILLANIPGTEPEKTDSHHVTKITP